MKGNHVVNLFRLLSAGLLVCSPASTFAFGEGEATDIVTLLERGGTSELVVTPATGQSNSVTLHTGNLDPGIYLLHIYLRDNRGMESPSVNRLLYVVERNEFTAYEYYIDVDPGAGMGVPVSLDAEGSASFAISTNDISEGIHNLVIRGKDESGEWCSQFEAPFKVTTDSGVGGIELIMDVKVSRRNGSVTLEAGNIRPGSRVEILTVDGLVAHSGTWNDPASPLEVSLDDSLRNCILTITSPDGQRLVKRIR